VLDRLNTEIKAYVTALDPEALTDADHRRVKEILCFTTNMEHAGDVVEHNLLSLAAKKIKRGLVFSKQGQTELFDIIDRLITNVRTAAALFVNEDTRAARLLAAEKEIFRDIEAQAPPPISSGCAPDGSKPPRPVRCISIFCATSSG